MRRGHDGRCFVWRPMTRTDRKEPAIYGKFRPNPRLRPIPDKHTRYNTFVELPIAAHPICITSPTHRRRHELTATAPRADGRVPNIAPPMWITGQVAGGTNLIYVTTGGGSAYGCAPVPSLMLASLCPADRHAATS